MARQPKTPDQLTALLADLVAFQTVSGDHTAMRQLLDYVDRYVRNRGLHVEQYNFNGFRSLVATTLPKRKTPAVMLAAHADVVAGRPEQFRLRQAKERYIGRGVLDMKYAIAVYLCIVDKLRGRLAEYDFGLAITPDEEIGGLNGMAKLVDIGYRPAVCILPDGGDNWQLQTSSKGFVVYDITARGKPAHGSRPWQGDNALTKLIGVLDEIASLFPRQPNADTNTISLTRINGGQAMNQVPAQATMTIDVRAVNQAEYDRLQAMIAAICEYHDLQWQIASQAAPTVSDLSTPLIADFARLVENVTGQTVVGSHALGASDIRYLAPHDIPCISLYPPGSGIHAEDEWISRQGVVDFQTIVEQYLAQTAIDY